MGGPTDPINPTPTLHKACSHWPRAQHSSRNEKMNCHRKVWQFVHSIRRARIGNRGRVNRRSLQAGKPFNLWYGFCHADLQCKSLFLLDYPRWRWQRNEWFTLTEVLGQQCLFQTNLPAMQDSQWNRQDQNDTKHRTIPFRKQRLCKNENVYRIKLLRRIRNILKKH